MVENNFSFKKIHALIPDSLYEELSQQNKFNDSWDAWLTKIISEALERGK